LKHLTTEDRPPVDIALKSLPPSERTPIEIPFKVPMPSPIMRNPAPAPAETLGSRMDVDQTSDRLADVVDSPVSAGTRGADLFAPPTPAVATSAVASSAVAASMMSGDYFRVPILPRVEAATADADSFRGPLMIPLYEAERPADPSANDIPDAPQLPDAAPVDSTPESADPKISPESAPLVIEISDDESDSELYKSNPESALEDGEINESGGGGLEEGEIDESGGRDQEVEQRDIGMGAWPSNPPLRVPGERYYDYIIDTVRESDGTMLYYFGGPIGWEKPAEFQTDDERRSLNDFKARWGTQYHKISKCCTMPGKTKKEIRTMIEPFQAQRQALLKERNAIFKAHKKAEARLRSENKEKRRQEKQALWEERKRLMDERKRVPAQMAAHQAAEAGRLEPEAHEAEVKELEAEGSDAVVQAESMQYRPQFQDQIVYAPRPKDKFEVQRTPVDDKAQRDAAKARKLAAADMVLGNEDAAVPEESQTVIQGEDDRPLFAIDLDGDAQMGEGSPLSRRERREQAKLERELQTHDKSASPARDSSPDFEILELDDKAKAEFDLKAQVRARTKETAHVQAQTEAQTEAQAARAQAIAQAKANGKAAKVKAKAKKPKPLTRKQRKEAQRRVEALSKAQKANKRREVSKGKAKATEPQPEPEQEPKVDLDLLLENLSRGSDPEPMPLLKAPPQVLGKRMRSRSLSPDIHMTEELFDEIIMINGLFKKPCMQLVASPAVFELAVAAHPDFKVNLSFSEGYPLVTPTPVAAACENGPQVQALAVSILADINDGKPCLEKLVKGLASGLSAELGHIDWKWNALGSPKFAVIPADSRWFPSLQELTIQMENIRAKHADYPPKLPAFEMKEGWNTAFVGFPYHSKLSSSDANYAQISESYAIEMMAKQGDVMEGNERLEFLGDSVLNALIATSLMKKYQLSEGGMTVRVPIYSFSRTAY
jgi:hypothetical protein